MKVLVVKPHLPLPPTQGTRRLTLGLLRDLSTAFDVHFLCMLEDRAEARHVTELEAMGITVRAPLAPHRRSPLHRAWFRARNDSMALISGHPRDYYYAAPSLLGRTLERWTREVAFDVVVLEYWKLAHLAEQVRSGRAVVLAHDAEFIVRDRKRTQTEEGGRPLAAWRLRREARREIDALKEAETILALTAQDGRDVAEALGEYGGEIHVLPVGTDVRPGAGRESAADTVGFVGSFKADFNVDALRHLLEEIWPRIRRSRPHARLLVAGGDLPHELAMRGRDAGVTFLGYVEDLPAFIESVRAFVVPLRYGGGLRIRLVEALTVGAAVVSTPVGAAGLELEPDRHYLEAQTPAAFAEAVVAVLANDELRRGLVEAGREEAIRRYGRESVRRRTVELFESLATRRTAA